MTPEDNELLSVLHYHRHLDQDRVNGKNGELERCARQKGITRSLVELFSLSEELLAQTISETFSSGRLKISSEINTAPTDLLTAEEIQRFRALPVFRVGPELTVAFVDPPSKTLCKHLRQLTGCKIIPVITTLTDFDSAIRKFSGSLDPLQRISSTLDISHLDLRNKAPGKPVPDAETYTESTIAQVVDELMLRAAKAGASDIHIEPRETELMVRLRIDGVLRHVASFHRSFHAGVISIIKSRSGMDMFERTAPQDGRLTLKFADRIFDVRINSLPTLFGEKMVLRLLSTNKALIDLEGLGFSEQNLTLFRELIRVPHGIILMTGPTGSGKTTTLYAAINEVSDIGRNFVTVENPVEYKFHLVNQVQIAPERGLTFASALRAILRQDPNVILVGEIRDSETGEIATEAALTGHLVLSTIHSNDSIGAIPRLINLGIDSFWVCASMIGVVGQRLVRRICPRCKEEFEPSESMLIQFGLSGLPKGTTLFRGRGCQFCAETGYKGRIAINEILVITEEMKDAIYGDVTISKLRKLAASSGFRDMYFDGLQKAMAGITTLEEVRRVARRSL
jgi:type IV pilus assembly protein PilB